MSDDRIGPPLQPDERASLVGFLDFLRQTVAWKVEGLNEEQARFSPGPSDTSPIGLVRHLVETERYWFPHAFLGEDRIYAYRTDEDRARDFHPRDDETMDEALATYASTWARSNEIVAAASIDDVAAVPHPDWGAANLRWILTHMIEETARHCGHLDILRELIDGTTGD